MIVIYNIVIIIIIIILSFHLNINIIKNNNNVIFARYSNAISSIILI